MRIQQVEIKNFRGIKTFNEFFGDKSIVCFAGRGNSTKSTILEAISLCLSARWSSISDADFYNFDTSTPIEIRVTLSDIPKKLLPENKFGLYLRQFNTDTKTFVETADEDNNIVSTITVSVNIDSTLEPEWYVVSENIEDKLISSRDRELFGVYLVSDYSDHHLAWSKGSPLYTLQTFLSKKSTQSKDVVLEVLREAKNAIESRSFSEFDELLDGLKSYVTNLGGNISDGKASVDMKDIAFRSNTISLHRNNKVPLRMDGKGLKRIVSIAIQKLLVKHGGIVLVDEIEQGLEPDRIKHLVRTLSSNNEGQIFITTHSGSVIEELIAHQIYCVSNENGQVSCSNDGSEKLQKLYRACPEAVYAKKVIICEGRTEIGICRAFDEWRVLNGKSNLAAIDLVYTDGAGDSLYERAMSVKELGIDVVIICDSDKKENVSKKQDCRDKGIEIFDWEDGLDIEHQIFKDIDSKGLLELIAISESYRGLDSIQQQIKLRIDQWDGKYTSLDTEERRKVLAEIATKKEKEWFKNITEAEKIGTVIFSHWDSLVESSTLKKVFTALNIWVDRSKNEGK